jgi:hypothetical protein
MNRAGGASWSSLTAALSETRAAFDRANHAAYEAFKKTSENKEENPEVPVAEKNLG